MTRVGLPPARGGYCQKPLGQLWHSGRTHAGTETIPFPDRSQASQNPGNRER